MNSEAERVELAGGGHLAFEEYGDPAGVPVLFCHGWPSSRTMARLTDAPAKKLGVRIISPDRPGINGSSFQKGRKLLDWPRAAEALMSHLRVERVRLLAISGGAPYAYATAWALPEKVEAMAIVSGAPPIADLPDRAGLLRLYRWMLAVHAHSPALLRAMFRLVRPFAATKMPLRFRPLLLLALQRMDADALRDSQSFEACFESSRQAWRASVSGVIADAEIYAQPWGFPLEEIGVPVRLWHGTKDRTFSFHLAEELAPRFCDCQLQIVPDAGHYSLPIRNMERILSDLISVPAPEGATGTFPVRGSASR
jgi:pimeloyl-ACP methyl ester carboxylesterase